MIRLCLIYPPKGNGEVTEELKKVTPAGVKHPFNDNFLWPHWPRYPFTTSKNLESKRLRKLQSH